MKIADLELYKKIKSRCRIADDDDCWEWAQYRQNGYGRVKHGPDSQYAHRLMYQAVRGPIEKGIDIGQSCENRACCNPKHLVAGSRMDTMARCVARGSQAKGMILSARVRGEKCHLAKLKQAQVDQIRIRLANDERPADLASEYSVSVDTILKIRRFVIWRTGFMSQMPARHSA